MGQRESPSDCTRSEIEEAYYDRVLCNLETIKYLYACEGRTIEQIADAIRVKYNVFYEIWFNPAFSELHTITHSREVRDKRAYLVEDAMYRLSVGFDREVEEPVKVKITTQYVNKKGKKCTRTDETIRIAKYTEHVAPSFQAAQFWLVNRSKGDWMNDQRLTVEAARQDDERKAEDSKPAGIVVRFVDPATKDQIDRLNAIDAKVDAGGKGRD